MTNPARNEVTIKLGETEYTARATFNFICEVEALFDLPLTSIVVDRLQQGSVKVKEIAAIIASGVKATGTDIDIEQLQNDIAEAGTVSAINQIIPLLMMSFSGPKNIKKK